MANNEIDIFDIEETVISRNLRDKIVFLYGDPKVGKTSNAVKFPKHLLLATEAGYNALSGVKAQKINKWSDFKKVLKQLDNEKAKEMYETIIVDTVDILHDLCEKFILDREEVEKIGDIAYGAGYKMVEKEYDEALRSIPMKNFGLVMISHATDKTFKDEKGEDYNKIVPTLAKSPHKIVTRMADIIGYARSLETEGGTKSMLYIRGTSRFEAGSRFKYTPEKIEFKYSELVDVIAEAIDKQEKEDGASTVNEHVNNFKDTVTYDFDDIKEKIQTLGHTLHANGKGKEVLKVVENYLGKGKKMKDANEDQLDGLVLILDDLNDLLEEEVK